MEVLALATRRRLFQNLLLLPRSPSSSSISTIAKGPIRILSPNGVLPRGSLAAPWAANQHRGVRCLGSEVRNGNVIQRKGRICQVLKAQHTVQGRGGATIQVELRDVDSGNKSTERFRTDESIEKDMVVKLQVYDGKVMSASVPQRVTCTVVEAQTSIKAQVAAPQYRRVVLDNGLAVLAPPWVKPGERIVVNTTDDSYMTRAKE